MGEPVGEDAWLDHVEECSRSARDLEQRVEVVELFKRAVSAEPYSLRLWLAYCEWIWSLHSDCQSSDAGWSEDEQLLGQELFSLETTLESWQQGSHATRFRLNDSHILWNRWISIELEQLATSSDKLAVDRVKNLFLERLQVPHAAWDDTSQLFSTFITKYDEEAWEETMIQSTKLAKRAKELYEQREVHELTLQRAIESGDKDAIMANITEYLDWEVVQSGKKGGIPALSVALYERALLQFSTDATLWEDYGVFAGSHMDDGILQERDANLSVTPDLLEILQRATKHCPWSGSLWSRYILRSEIEQLSFSDIEQIKHAATSMGQLDRNGMADVIAVYSAWCGCLRRRAMSEDASDEDVDVADVGFSSALETVQEWGERLYGKKVYKGDPTFQLERAWVQYLTQKGVVDEARAQWMRLVKSHGDSYDFWQRFYIWEMSISHPDSYRRATAVLKQAVVRKGLDWPEKIMEIYLQHCNTYEDAEVLSTEIDTVYRKTKGVAKRRQREAEAAAAAYTMLQETSTTSVTDEFTTVTSPSGASKRKRDSISEENANVAKKVKADQEDNQLSENLKRDRENTSVLVTNLPPDVTQTKVRQYFREYGHVNNLTLKTEDDGQSSTALIEFRSTNDVKSALIKDGKFFADKQINVEPGTGLTLYVTNYPPAADETYMRNLFKDCGEILSIRWPSLKFNTHRRFCYISFKSAIAAASATSLDGKLLEGQYRLEAKYSDPSRKKQREGALIEGREIHVSHIDRTVTEDELREIFSKYGGVENVRILRNIAGRSKGSGFVVFEKKENATDALELDKTKLKSQILTVEIAAATNFKPTSTTSILKDSSASPAPETGGDIEMSNSPGPEIPSSNTHTVQGPSKEDISSRTITIMNVPDTFNDARIRALVEPYGSIVKFVLRLDHQGAIIEYDDVTAAGRAALGLENYEIEPGRKIRTGGLKDLFQEKDEIKTDKIQSGGGKKPTLGGLLQPAAPMRRPGGRGGLGSKRGLGYSSMGSKAQASGVNGSQVVSNEKPAPKSNADFKAMFLKSEDT